MANVNPAVSVRVSPHERALLEAAAEQARTNLSDFVRRKAVEAAEMELLDQRLVTISPAEWEKFEAWAHAPAKSGRCGTMTHDYKRHGTTTLFAALDVLQGKVIGRCMQRHRHEEFIRFLNAVEREVPAGKAIEAVVDNYVTHKHPKVQAWLKRHPRWTFHFTPTSASWLNAVENFLSALTRKRIRRGSFHSIVDLQAAIKRYLAEHNANPKPFLWTASAASILAKLDRLPVASV